MTPLKQVRTELGLGLRELARRANVTKDTVWTLEAQRLLPANARYGDLVRIFRALRRAGLRGQRMEDLFPV